MRRVVAATALALTVVLSGCASGDSGETTQTTAGLRRADAAEAVKLIGQGYTVIDVRTPEEFAQGHLKGATNINVESADFPTEASKLDKAGKYVVYCRSGNRSAQALEKMKRLGFTDVVDAGGIQPLIDAGAPTA